MNSPEKNSEEKNSEEKNSEEKNSEENARGSQSGKPAHQGHHSRGGFGNDRSRLWRPAGLWPPACRSSGSIGRPES